MKTESLPGRGVALALALAATPVLAAPPPIDVAPMAVGVAPGWSVSDPLLTIGETFTGTSGALNPSTTGDYTPVGILDGLGAYELEDDDDDGKRKGRDRRRDDVDDEGTIRVFANHELLNFRGNAYEVGDGMGGTFTMTGARISYFDIDKETRQITDAGLAYNTIYDANGNVASDTSFLLEGFGGFSRFCSGMLVEAGEFNRGKSRGKGRARGLEDTIYFAGEEDGGNFNPVGGAEWALDVETGDFWQLPDLGRGAWENVTVLDTGTASKVAVLLADDSSPFDADGDNEVEAAPLFLYVGKKKPNGNFIERNGLSGGKLYVWVSDSGDLTPLDFRGSGTRSGKWVEVDNTPVPALASENGSTGYDEYGYPTQRNLWTQAEALGAFGFSRPEDVATNPQDGSEAVLASTGVDTYAVDPASGDGADSFGTMYIIKTNFAKMTADVTIIYDGDADVANRALRSPDNLDWADDGYIYVQEDEAEEDTLTGEPLFGPGATNPNEAGIVQLDPVSGAIVRVANIDRSAVFDGSIDAPYIGVDVDAGLAGEWESSGILDVSELFDEDPGTLFLFDVQAHGIEDQTDINPMSRINDNDLVEGGQLLFLELDND